MSRQTSAGNNDTLLLDRFLNGDDQAFIELFRRYNEQLFLYCTKVVGSGPVGEDLTQEVWERVIDLRRYPKQIRSLPRFMLRVARNLCIDHLRKERRLVPLDDLDETELPPYELPEPSRMEELALAALERLPFDYREVLVLNLYCGYRLDEIAEMLEKSSEAVWACASRARRRLRKMILADALTDVAGTTSQ